MSRAASVASVLRRASALDRDWQRKVPEDDRRYTPWMPFSAPAFISLLAEAVQALAEYGTPDGSDDLRFLDVGCGPGPKMLIARTLFGLDVRGFDRCREYAMAARTLGLHADIADAGEYGGYGWPHVTWFNRVARDADLQVRIEAAVWRGTRPGGLVMGANLESPPPPSWFTVLDDWEIRRGIWRKPDAAPGTG